MHVILNGENNESSHNEGLSFRTHSCCCADGNIKWNVVLRVFSSRCESTNGGITCSSEYIAVCMESDGGGGSLKVKSKAWLGRLSKAGKKESGCNDVLKRAERVKIVSSSRSFLASQEEEEATEWTNGRNLSSKRKKVWPVIRVANTVERNPGGG